MGNSKLEKKQAKNQKAGRDKGWGKQNGRKHKIKGHYKI